MVMIATILLPFAFDAPCAFTVEAIVLKRIGFVYKSYLDSRLLRVAHKATSTAKLTNFWQQQHFDTPNIRFLLIFIITLK